jgi:hypothetical protein
LDASFKVPIQARPHLLVLQLLQEALVVHVSAVLVEKTMVSHDALARYELEKVVASHQAHAC